MDLIPFARASNELILKLFGPSAEYLGEHWRSKLEERAQRNAGRVATRAIEKLGSRIEEPGEIPPRALRGILEEAQYSEDEVSVEYVSGVLASSRTPDGKDDRAISITATISRLSSFSLLAHYIWYTELKRIFNGIDTDNLTLSRALMFMPYSVFDAAIGDDLADDFGNFTHAIQYLEKESLVSGVTYGSADTIREYLRYESTQLLGPPALPEDASGMLIAPTSVGLDLYLWSQGAGGVVVDYFFEDYFKPELIPGIVIPDGARSVGGMFREAGFGTIGFIE